MVSPTKGMILREGLQGFRAYEWLLPLGRRGSGQIKNKRTREGRADFVQQQHSNSGPKMPLEVFRVPVTRIIVFGRMCRNPYVCECAV